MLNNNTNKKEESRIILLLPLIQEFNRSKGKDHILIDVTKYSSDG